MALLAFSTGMWVLSSTFTAYKPNEGFYEIISSFVYVFGILTVSLLVHLVAIFPYPLFKVDRLHKVLFYIPSLIFILIALVTNGIQLSATGGDNEPGKVIPGPIYGIYNLFVTFLYLFTVGILVNRLGRLEGFQKKFLSFLLIAVIVGGLPAVIIDLILPVLNPKTEVNYLYGVLFTGFWLGTTVYLVNKKN